MSVKCIKLITKEAKRKKIALSEREAGAIIREVDSYGHEKAFEDNLAKKKEALEKLNKQVTDRKLFRDYLKDAYTEATETDILLAADRTKVVFEGIGYGTANGKIRYSAQATEKAWGRWIKTGEEMGERGGRSAFDFGIKEFEKNLRDVIDERQSPEEIKAEDLSVGDKFTIEGEKYEVKKIDPDTEIVTIKDGETINLKPQQELKIDRGSLKHGIDTEAPFEIEYGKLPLEDRAGLLERQGRPDLADKLRQEEMFKVERNFPQGKLQGKGKQKEGFEMTEEIKARENEKKQGEITLDSLGLQTIYETLEGYAKSGKPQEGIEHLTMLGKSVYAEGKTTLQDFTQRMKEHLGKLWDSFKDMIKSIYNSVKAFNERLGERGSIGRGETTPSKIADLFEADLSKLSEDELKSYLRTSIQAGQKMYREGKREEGDKYKARAREIIAKGRAKKGIKKDIKTANRIIEKSIGKIALDYQDKVKELFNDIDFTKPTEDTIERLKGLKAFIDREGVPLGMPRSKLIQLERLSKTPFREMSKEARDELIETAKDLYDLGRLKRKLQLNKEMREQEKNLEALIESTKNLDPSLSGEKKPTALDDFKKGINFIESELLHTFRYADKIDGSKDYQGENTALIKKEMHAEIAIKNQNNTMIHKVLTDIKALGINDIDYESDMAKRINITLYHEQGARGAVQELMNLWGLKEIPTLNETERKVVELLRNPFNQIVDKTITVYEKRENIRFVKVNNYFPLRYEGDEFLNPFESIDQNKNRYRTKQVEQGFTIVRKPDVKMTPRTDFLAVMEEAIFNQLWYNQMQPLLDEHHTLINTPEYKDAAGERAWNWWKDQIDIVGRKGWSAQARSTPWTRLLRRGRVNIGRAVLGYKISSTVLQLFSVSDAVAYTTSHYGVSAGIDVAVEFSKAWSNPVKIREFIEATPALKSRNTGEIAIEETMKGQNIDISYKGIQFTDIITAAGVEKGLLKVLEKNNVSNAKAEADFLMNVVSGSSEITIRPHILARGEGARTWFTFQTFFLNRWGIISHDLIRTGLKGNWKRKALTGLGLAVLMAGGMAEDEARDLIFNWTTGKNSNISNEALLTKIILYIPRQIPVIGNLFEIMGTAEPPIMRPAKQIGTGTKQVLQGKPISGLTKLTESVMTLILGIPGTTQLFDFMERLFEEEKKKEQKRR